MKTPNFRLTTLLIILIAGALALAGCDRLDGELVLPASRTPAPETGVPSPAEASGATTSFTETPPAIAAAPSETPAVQFGAIVGGESPTAPLARPTQLPSATTTPQPVTPAPGGPFGPINGPDHTLAPTETRAPTQTANPSVPFGPIVGPDHTLVPTETRIPPTPIPSIEPTPGPSPTPGPGLQSALMGIQIHPHIDSREIETVIGLTRELGVTWVKFQFAWSLLESERGRYTEQYFMLTDYVKRLRMARFA